MAFYQSSHDPVFVFDGALQTCSVREVVSFNTVFNGDVHQSHSLHTTARYPIRSLHHSSRFATEGQAELLERA
jgi:hypothetical protein